MRIELQADGAASLLQSPPADGVGVAWLGQAGFVIASAKTRVVIDPYLSDRLAEKYRGTHFPHTRLMPPPVLPEQLTDIDVVFCTHRHGDHMDPGTLHAIAAASQRCRFVVPAAELDAAAKAGAPVDRTIGVEAGNEITLADELSVTVLPAAHETREFDPDGRDRYLGYAIRLAGITLYHSGDCVPFEGLVDLDALTKRR